VRERIDAELGLMGRRASGEQEAEIRSSRASQARPARRRGLVQDVHGLPGPNLPRRRHSTADGAPQVADSPLLTHDHPRAASGDSPGESLATAAGRDGIGADVARRGQPAVVLRAGGEAPEPTPGKVLEKNPLDR